MAKYIVTIEPRPTDTIYIQFSDGQRKQEHKVENDMPVELHGEPEEIIIRRETTFLRRFISWHCKCVNVSSLDSEGKEFYFPVFQDISSTSTTIKESSAKLPFEDPSEARQEFLRKNQDFHDTLNWHGKVITDLKPDPGAREWPSVYDPSKGDIPWQRPGKGEIDIPPETPPPSVQPTDASSKSYPLIATIFLRIINVFPEKLNFKHKPGLPGFVRGGNPFDLPKQLWFTSVKLTALFLSAFKVALQKLFRKLWNRFNKWNKLDDIRGIFWFPSKKAAYISTNWKDDAFFGSLFLNGCNPIMIKKFTEDQQKIPMETLEEIYPDIKKNITSGNIYVVDYELLDGLPTGTIGGRPQYLAAPIVLLQDTQKELKPIAIQLKQKPGQDNPVFTPRDKPEAWLLAKIWVRNSDFYMHELVAHLLRSHLMGEIFFIAVQSMPSFQYEHQHPISRILYATGRYTLPINITARNTLINASGFFEKFTAFGENAHWDVLTRATKEMTYQSLCLPDNLKHRGVENLANYHYKDDGMDIWDAIYKFVSEVVYEYYTDDSKIQTDKELKHLVSKIYDYGFLQKPDCPQTLKTREEAIKYITMIMFTCSAQHASVNNGQYDIYAWMPNGPTTMQSPPPVDKEVTEQYIMESLPDINTTLESMRVAAFLSHRSKDFVPLGKYPEVVAFDKRMRGPIERFQKRLKEIEKKIEKRSTLKDFPYEYLHPAHMENSITI